MAVVLTYLPWVQGICDVINLYVSQFHLLL
jgi:hypothetical protein